MERKLAGWIRRYWSRRCSIPWKTQRHGRFTGDGDMALADSPVKDGKHSLRIRSTQNIGKVGGAGEWEDLIASRKFPSEDWSAYNRISIWVYPDVIGAPTISSSLVLHNAGAHRLPDHYNEEEMSPSTSRITNGITSYGKLRLSTGIRSRNSILRTACPKCFRTRAIRPSSTSTN